ncbi:MAG: beta-lactamase family protein, partial [Devosia sp.]|nr:beta-lactamase family protein [Devosia sp.]
GQATTLDTIFRLASLSKPVTATACLAMVDRGELRLDDVITRFLPQFRPRLADGSTPDITIRQLLTHTSGLTYRFAQWPGGSYHLANVSDGLDQPGLDMEENLRRIASAPLQFAPGTQWGYAVGIDVLGHILAVVRGTTLGAVIADLVTGPLGMRDTGFTVADRQRLSLAYADNPDGAPVPMDATHSVPRPTEPPTLYSPARVLDPRSFQSGGAGLTGTAPDFAKFLEALRTGHPQLLRPPTRAAALRNQIGDLAGDAGGSGWRFGFLSGVLVDPRLAATPQSAGTFYWGGAHGNTWFLDPERQLSFVGLTNTAVEGVDGRFPREVRDAIYGV